MRYALIVTFLAAMLTAGILCGDLVVAPWLGVHP